MLEMYVDTLPLESYSDTNNVYRLTISAIVNTPLHIVMAAR